MNAEQTIDMAVNPWVQAAMIEIMQQELNRQRRALAALQQTLNGQADEPHHNGHKRGRPKKITHPDAIVRAAHAMLTAKTPSAKNPKQYGASSWAHLTAEQRSAEMKRRQAVARGEAPSRSQDSTRRERLQRHDSLPLAAKSNSGDAQRAYYAKLTPVERRKRQQAVMEGKRKAAAARAAAGAA